MKLTTKGRYAVTAMMDLALQSQNQSQRTANTAQSADSDESRVALTDIAARQDISLSYLEQLFASLRKAGLVNAVRGPGGGYAIAKKADDISVAAILAAVDENLDLTCGSGSACGGDHDPCLTHGLWSNLSNELYKFLDGKKLADIIQKPPESQAIASATSATTPATTQDFSGIPIEVS